MVANVCWRKCKEVPIPLLRPFHLKTPLWPQSPPTIHSDHRGSRNNASHSICTKLHNLYWPFTENCVVLMGDCTIIPLNCVLGQEITHFVTGALKWYGVDWCCWGGNVKFMSNYTQLTHTTYHLLNCKVNKKHINQNDKTSRYEHIFGTL